MSLPEASGRRAAAERLAADNTSKTLTPADAASLLRGLPTESNTTAKEADTTMTTLSSTDAERFRRLAEIRVATLSLNGARGNEKAKLESKKLAHALSHFDHGGIAFSEALEGVGLNVEDTIARIVRAR